MLQSDDFYMYMCTRVSIISPNVSLYNFSHSRYIHVCASFHPMHFLTFRICTSNSLESFFIISFPVWKFAILIENLPFSLIPLYVRLRCCFISLFNFQNFLCPRNNICTAFYVSYCFILVARSRTCNPNNSVPWSIWNNSIISEIKRLTYTDLISAKWPWD